MADRQRNGAIGDAEITPPWRCRRRSPPGPLGVVCHRIVAGTRRPSPIVPTRRDRYIRLDERARKVPVVVRGTGGSGPATPPTKEGRRAASRRVIRRDCAVDEWWSPQHRRRCFARCLAPVPIRSSTGRRRSHLVRASAGGAPVGPPAPTPRGGRSRDVAGGLAAPHRPARHRTPFSASFRRHRPKKTTVSHWADSCPQVGLTIVLLDGTVRVASLGTAPDGAAHRARIVRRSDHPATDRDGKGTTR